MAIARWQDLCIDVTEGAAERARAFWAAALHLRPQPHPRTHGQPWRLTGDLPSQTVWLNPVPEPHTVKNRVHLDVHCASIEELEALGARRLSAPGEFGWTVMADPDDGEFCGFVRDEVPSYRLYEIVVDVDDPLGAARWWGEVLGGDVGGGGDEAWVEKAPGVPFEGIVFGTVPEPKTVKNRVHWDVAVATADGVERLVAHGATVLRRPGGDIHWHVLADPEGNEFCVFVD